MYRVDGFRLTKFVSNSKELLMLIPQKDRRQEAPDKRLLETTPDNKEHWVYFGTLKTTN